MTSVTLATLRTRVRERADMPVAGFVADSATGIDAFINEGVQILHDKMVRAYEADYMETSAAFTLNASGEVALPSDFYKLLGVELTSSNGGYTTLLPYKRAERNGITDVPFGDLQAPRYKLTTNTLKVLPASVAAGKTGRILYAPTATVLVATGDAVNFPNGWERYVVVYAAIQCLAKEESDTAFLERTLAQMDRQIDEMISNRDAGMATHAMDVERTGFGWWW